MCVTFLGKVGMHMLSVNAEVDTVLPLQPVWQCVLPFSALAGISGKTILFISHIMLKYQDLLNDRFVWL